MNFSFSCKELYAEKSNQANFSKSQRKQNTFIFPVLTSEQQYASSAKNLGLCSCC